MYPASWGGPDAQPDGAPTLKMRTFVSIRIDRPIYAAVGAPDAPTPLKSGGGDDVAGYEGPVSHGGGL